MGVASVGSVLLVKFPYSDLSSYKNRPAIVVAKAEFNNLVLCQITSQKISSKMAVNLNSPQDFDVGKLPLSSFIRTDKIFTADSSLIVRELGKVSDTKLQEVRSQIRKLFE